MSLDSNNKGFSLIELLLAIALIVVFAALFAQSIVEALASMKSSEFQTQALLHAQEGIEAVRTIRDQDFALLSTGTFGVQMSGNTWTLVPSPTTDGIYSRSISISDPGDGSRLINSEVSWIQFQVRPRTISLSIQLYNWQDEIDIPPPIVDTTPPEDISDLTISSPTEDSLTLSWTAPGDDADIGTATSYDIRFRSIILYRPSSGSWSAWDTATQLTGEPAPNPAGSSESLVVTGLSPNTLYEFAMATSDEVPNTSDVSNVTSGRTAAIVCSQLGYTDDDDDGYGVGSEVCVDGFATWASQGGDCYDQNANARPNQTSYFSSHRGDGSYDYNCVSGNEKRWTTNVSGSGCYSRSNQCNAQRNKWRSSSDPSCGTSASWSTSCNQNITWEQRCFGFGSRTRCFNFPTITYCLNSTSRTQQCR